MKNTILFLCLLFLFGENTHGQTKSDGQFWATADFTVGLKKGKDQKGKSFDKIALLFSGIDRFGDTVSRPVDQRLGVFLDFRVNKFLTITPGYLYQKAAPLRTNKNFETRLSIAATLNKRKGDFNFRTRQQLEHKFRHNRADNQNYRPLFQVNYFVKRDKKELFSPFVSEEGYYDSLSKTWVRNEFRVGVARTLNKNISADFYYIRVNTKPLRVNGFGIAIKVKLR